MAECARCGRGYWSMLTGAVKTQDKKLICIKCLKELGWEHPYKDAVIIHCHTAEDLIHPERKWQRDYAAAINRRAARLEISPAQYYSLDQANATEFEFKVFARICALLEDEKVDSKDLVVAPGDNGSLLVMKDGTVLIEYRGDPNIKWIRLSDEPDNKIRFAQVGKLNGLADRIIKICS